MKFRKYKGPDVPSVLRRVRRELGEEAVIIKTEEKVEGGVLGFFGTRVVEVLVAVPDDVASERRSSGLDLSLPREIPDVASPTAECGPSFQPSCFWKEDEEPGRDERGWSGKGDGSRPEAKGFLPLGISLEEGDYPRRVIAFGPPGSGKTSALGRLAWHFSSSEKVTLVSVEEEGRLSGASRWRAFWEVLGVDFLPVKGFQGLREVAQTIEGVVLVDTPPLSRGYRDELYGACRDFSLTPLLVVDAIGDIEEFRRLLDGYISLPGLRVVVSKMDVVMAPGRREAWRRELAGLRSYLSDSPSINRPLKPLVILDGSQDGVKREEGVPVLPSMTGSDPAKDMNPTKNTVDLEAELKAMDSREEALSEALRKAGPGGGDGARAWVPRRLAKG